MSEVQSSSVAVEIPPKTDGLVLDVLSRHIMDQFRTALNGKWAYRVWQEYSERENDITILPEYVADDDTLEGIDFVNVSHTAWRLLTHTPMDSRESFMGSVARQVNDQHGQNIGIPIFLKLGKHDISDLYHAIKSLSQAQERHQPDKPILEWGVADRVTRPSISYISDEYAANSPGRLNFGHTLVLPKIYSSADLNFLMFAGFCDIYRALSEPIGELSEAESNRVIEEAVNITDHHFHGRSDEHLIEGNRRLINSAIRNIKASGKAVRMYTDKSAAPYTEAEALRYLAVGLEGAVAEHLGPLVEGLSIDDPRVAPILAAEADLYDKAKKEIDDHRYDLSSISVLSIKLGALSVEPVIAKAVDDQRREDANRIKRETLIAIERKYAPTTHQTDSLLMPNGQTTLTEYQASLIDSGPKRLKSNYKMRLALSVLARGLAFCEDEDTRAEFLAGVTKDRTYLEENLAGPAGAPDAQPFVAALDFAQSVAADGREIGIKDPYLRDFIQEYYLSLL